MCRIFTVFDKIGHLVDLNGICRYSGFKLPYKDSYSERLFFYD